MIKIKKKYERLVNIGNYENVKVGVELTKEVQSTDVKEIKKMMVSLGKLAEIVTLEEVDTIQKAAKDRKIGTEADNG